MATSLSAAKSNNFNFIRLFLATAVLLAHSFELVDGDSHREILTRLFHTDTCGGLAINGFFLLSGYLIVQSWTRTPNLFDFLKKRVLRIYPGFIVASMVSALIVGPLGSNARHYFSQFDLAEFLKGLLVLSPPVVPPVFQGQPHALLNGAMWTIGYEFVCYSLVALLGFCGIVKRRRVWLFLASALLLFYPALLFLDSRRQISAFGLSFVFDHLLVLIRFLCFFYVGGCFYLFADRIRYQQFWAMGAVVLLFLSMFRGDSAQFALATLGAYLLFWFAFTPIAALNWFKTYPDISYGSYLYGWPIQKLLCWYIPHLSPYVLFLTSCLLSYACGFLSWNWVERPFLRFKKRAVHSLPLENPVVAT